MRQIDERILEWTQATYLWILDKTGLYLGTCVIVAYLAGKFTLWSIDEIPDAFDIVIVVIVLLISQRTWYLQHAKMYATLNVVAGNWQNNSLRKIFAGLSILCILPLVILEHDRAAGIAASAIDVIVVTWTFCYLVACRVRDREPPEKKFCRLAGESST